VKYNINWAEAEITAYDIRQLRKRKTMNFLLTAIFQETKGL